MQFERCRYPAAHFRTPSASCPLIASELTFSLNGEPVTGVSCPFASAKITTIWTGPLAVVPVWLAT